MRIRSPLLFVVAALRFVEPPACAAPPADVIRTYCADCHDAEARKGDLDLISLLPSDAGAHADKWEKAVRQLEARQMPPLGKKRPDEKGYQGAITALTTE